MTTLLTLVLLYRAAGNDRLLSGLVLVWLLLQGGLTLSGFYLNTLAMPPRFSLLVIPPVTLAIAWTFLGKGAFDPGRLTLLHLIRVLVELLLYALFVHQAVPQLMTFEGGNLDILSGLTAPLIWYFGFVKGRIPRAWLISWNVICLLLLFNIVGRAILSAPFPFQRLAFDQPNVALLYFPYSWLPAFMVPAVLFAHLMTLKHLLAKPAA